MLSVSIGKTPHNANMQLQDVMYIHKYISFFVQSKGYAQGCAKRSGERAEVCNEIMNFIFVTTNTSKKKPFNPTNRYNPLLYQQD